MTITSPRVQKLVRPLVGSIAALLLGGHIPASAVDLKGGDSFIWLNSPVNGSWDNSSNWSPNGVPNSSTATATFNKSNITSIGFNNFSFHQLGSAVFNSGASSYTITLGPFSTLEFDGAGVVNNSGKIQNFLIGSDGNSAGEIDFYNSSNAGKKTVFTVMGGSDGGEGSPGRLTFNDNSSAGGATLIALGGAPSTFRSPPIGSDFFAFFSSFLTTGGGIEFNGNSTGGTAAVKLYGNGFLDISDHNPGSVTIGSLEGNGLVFLGSNNLAVGSNDQSTVFSGVIQDGGEGGGTGGSLTKVGKGVLALNGVNTYTGNTSINEGTLLVNGSIASPFTFVNPNGILGGHGIIGGSVINNGLVSPGNSPGTLTINGNYTQTGSGGLLIQVASRSVYDRLIVGGTANLNGTITIDALDPSKLKKGETFEFLTAGGGISGVFSNVDNADNGTLLRFKVKYGSNDVFLTTYVAPFTSIGGLTQNQQSVANILNKLSNDNGANKLINFLATQPISQLPGDFDKLAAEEFTSIFAIGQSYDNVQSLSLQSYFESLHAGGSGGFGASGLSLNGFSINYAGPIDIRTGSAGPTGDDGKDSKTVQQVMPTENRWGAFITGTGQWVGVSDDSNAKGYDIATGGFTLGLDYKLTPHVAVGILAGYVGTGVDAADGGRVFVNGGKIGLYATAFQNRQPVAPPSSGMSKDSSKESKEVVVPAEVDPGWYADVAVVGGYSSYDMRRSGLLGTARGDTDGGDLNVLFGTGYDFKRGNFTFGPTASFNYTYVGVGSFTESGSLAPLHIDSQGQESIRTAFGAKASYDWKCGSLLIRPEIRAAWQHEYGDNTYALTSSFADGNAGNFTVWGPRTGRDSFLVGAGFSIQLSERLSTYFYYDGELARTRYDSHAVSGGVRLAF